MMAASTPGREITGTSASAAVYVDRIVERRGECGQIISLCVCIVLLSLHIIVMFVCCPCFSRLQCDIHCCLKYSSYGILCAVMDFFFSSLLTVLLGLVRFVYFLCWSVAAPLPK